VSVQALNLDDALSDLIFTNPDNQGDSSVERVLDLLRNLRVVIVKNFSSNVSFPKFAQNLEAFSSQVLADLSDHHLGLSGARILFLHCLFFQNGEYTFE
jgi:hypothetical protein